MGPDLATVLVTFQQIAAEGQSLVEQFAHIRLPLGIKPLAVRQITGPAAPRLGQGYATLLEHALKGKGAMPPQGGGDFEDVEIGRAVVYLANSGGAKFEVPDRPAAAAPADGTAPAGGAASAAASAPAPAASK